MVYPPPRVRGSECPYWFRWSAFSWPAVPFSSSQGHPRATCGLAPILLGALNDSTIDTDHRTQDVHPTSNSQTDAT